MCTTKNISYFAIIFARPDVSFSARCLADDYFRSNPITRDNFYLFLDGFLIDLNYLVTIPLHVTKVPRDFNSSNPSKISALITKHNNKVFNMVHTCTSTFTCFRIRYVGSYGNSFIRVVSRSGIW